MAKTELAQNKEKIIEVGKILCMQGINERLAVCLLHNHFHLHDGEVLLERYIDENLIEISPIKHDVNQKIYPYMWRALKSANEEFCWYPIEFTSIDGDYSLPDVTTLNLIAQALDSLGILDIFGIAIVHRELSQNDQTILLETTDVETRTLSIQVTDKSVLLDDDISETLWKFLETDHYSISGVCERHCYSHCVSHCRRHED